MKVEPVAQVEEALVLAKKLLGTDKENKPSVNDLNTFIKLELSDKLGANYEKFATLTRLIKHVQMLTNNQLVTRLATEEQSKFNEQVQQDFYCTQQQQDKDCACTIGIHLL